MEFKPSRYEWESGGNDKTPDLDSITDVGSRFVLGFLHFFARSTVDPLCKCPFASRSF